MEQKSLTTSEAAERIGIHPNTLRWYDSQKLLPDVPRTGSGYRIFTPRLVTQAQIISLCHKVNWIIGPVRDMSFEIIYLSRDGKTAEASGTADEMILYLKREQQLAQEALNVLKLWERGYVSTLLPGRDLITIKKAAELLSLTNDQIRNWERNGLLIIPRDPKSRYRLFGDEDLNRMRVIRFCLRAGFSLTAIRRLLQVVDRSLSGPLPDLSYWADTPTDNEKNFFNTFPTDTLLKTLSDCLRCAERIKTELKVLEQLL